MKEIAVEELARWREDRKPFTLVDVREPSEVATASIEDASCIPLRELPLRIGELDRTTTVAVLCHHGGRSALAAQILEARGFRDVVNVEGGIDAYSLRVDSSVPRY